VPRPYKDPANYRRSFSKISPHFLVFPLQGHGTAVTLRGEFSTLSVIETAPHSETAQRAPPEIFPVRA
jgi:hypothetical protein